jgi:DNA repair protein SbcD/Mre11
MKTLHTSDWHLGRSLYGRKRYDEFSAFLNWLLETIKAESIEVLLIAGDIFDTSTPSNQAQALYYQFLARVGHTCCRHVVVIGGNHDSPSFLNAPKALLQALNVYVVGAMTEKPEDEVIVLKNHQSQIEAIVCAVPYLRDKDIRTVEAGETIDDKNNKLIEGLRAHYAQVCRYAELQRQMHELQNSKQEIPIIGMGHLFAAGAKTIDGDGVRELYVGSLAHVGHDIFPACIDYMALGHLHVPQCISGIEFMRYSGSPIAMGFGESKQQKQVVTIEFEGKLPVINKIHVPCFQRLERVSGDIEAIQNKISELKTQRDSIWLEVEYTGSEIIGNLREIMEESVSESTIEIQRIKNKQLIHRMIHKVNEDETLDDLTTHDIFQRCLASSNVPDEQWPELLDSYNEILQLMQNEDVNAE